MSELLKLAEKGNKQTETGKRKISWMIKKPGGGGGAVGKRFPETVHRLPGNNAAGFVSDGAVHVSEKRVS